MLAQGLISKGDLQEMEADVARIVEDAIQYAEQSPYPELEEALEDVFVS